MTCVFNAMLTDGAKKPMNANTFYKILTALAMGLLSILSLARPDSVQAMKFRHILSIYSDDRDQGLKHPEGVGCRQNSHLIVADTGNARLVQYRFEGRNLPPNILQIKLPQLTYPQKIKIDSRQDIYILDGKQRRIVRIAGDGKFKGYLDPRGVPSPAAVVPRSFHIDQNDNFYILDALSERVLVLSPEGQYRRQIKFPRQYGFFSDLTVDAKGNIFVIDSVKGVVFSAAGDTSGFSALTESLRAYMRFPTGLSIDSRGRIFLVDRNGGKIIILAQNGSYLAQLSAMGWTEGLLSYPSQVCLNDSGEVIVADTRNNRVQIFAVIE